MSSSNPQRRRERRDAMRGNRQERLRRQQAVQRRNRLLAALAGVVVIALIAGYVAIRISNNGTKTNGNGNLGPMVAVADPYPNIPQQTKVLGDPNALRLIEYGDYQCVACHNAQQSTVPALIQKYVATGALSFEFRDYLVIDAGLARTRGSNYDHESLRAAEAAMCAGDQGKYWPYHASLYQNWTGEGVGDFTESRVKDLAAKLNLDTSAFNKCLDSNKYEDEVKKQDSDATAAGINSTPTFMINGQQISGKSLDDYYNQIDSILAAKGVIVPAAGETPVAAETPAATPAVEAPAGSTPIGATPIGATPVAARPDPIR